MNHLILRALRDEKAMKELLLSIEDTVFKFAFSLCKHQQDAEDVAQESLYKICKNLNSFKGESLFETWIYRIVVNTFKDKRKKVKNNPTEVVFESKSESSFESEVDFNIHLQDVLNTLSDEERILFSLRFDKNASVREMSEILELSESNIKVKVFRLKEKIRNAFLKGGLSYDMQ